MQFFFSSTQYSGNRQVAKVMPYSGPCKENAMEDGEELDLPVIDQPLPPSTPTPVQASGQLLTFTH